MALPMSFTLNPPFLYSTECGMYSPHCGLDSVTMSWGHDEYLYRVLENHGHSLPDEALAMIRYALRQGASTVPTGK